MQTINWRELKVYGEDGFLGLLGELVSDGDAGLDHCEAKGDGSIDIWPQHFVAAPDEEPDWDTPRVAVDWTGFAESLADAISRL